MSASMKRICVLFISTLSLCTNLYALEPFEGVEMGEISLEGKSYVFPIVPEDGKVYAVSKNDLYYIKKAIEGDKIAYEVLLGPNQKREFFIGLETPLWLVVTDSKMEVVKP